MILMFFIPLIGIYSNVYAINATVFRGEKIVYQDYIPEAQANYGTFRYFVTDDEDGEKINMAYCVNADLTARSEGETDKLTELSMDTEKNIQLYKILYCGFYGNGDVTASYFGDNLTRRYLFTHIAAGIVFSDSNPYKGITKDIADNYRITEFINYAISQPLPEGARVFIIGQEVNKETGILEQGIAYIKETKNVEDAPRGGVKIKKKGTVLTSFSDGQFIWEEGGIPGVQYEVYAGEDLYYMGNLEYAKGQR